MVSGEKPMGDSRRIITKENHMAVSDYVGHQGELFYDTVSGVLKISDGSTPGGINISGGFPENQGLVQFPGNMLIGSAHPDDPYDNNTGLGDKESVVWADNDTEYLGLWWGGDLTYPNVSYGPLAGIMIGQNYFSSDDFVDYPAPASTNITLGINGPIEPVFWTFDGFGGVSLPNVSIFTSGGQGEKGSASFGTQVFYAPNRIVDGEAYMGSGYGEFRSIYNYQNGADVTLTYAGVEDVQNGNYSGIISQSPFMTGQYNVRVNSHDNIILGAAQYDGQLMSTEWSTAVGSINNRYTMNGMYASGLLTNVTGGSLGSSKVVLDDNGLKLVTQIFNYDGPDPSPYWYSLYGNLATGSPEVITGASLAYASDDTLYMIGAHVDTNTFAGNSLAIKYDTDGNIVWRKDWVAANGEFCGSWNNTFYVDRFDDDRIYWTSMAFNNGPGTINYLGRMDRDGNITEMPLRCEDIIIADMQVLDTTGNVIIAGSQIVDGQYMPMIAQVNILENKANFYGNTCVQGSIAGQTQSWNSVSQDYNTGQFVTMGTYTNSDAKYRPMIKLWSGNGTPGTTYDVADGLDASHGYDGIAAYFFDGNVYATFADYGSGCSYVTKYDRFDLTTKLWQVRIGDANQTYVYDLAFNNNYLYAGGISQGFNPPTSDTDFFLWSLNAADGTLNWNLSIGTNLNEGVTSFYDTPSCRGLAVSNYGDYVSMTGYVDSPTNGQPVLLTFQLPADGSITGDYHGLFIESYNLGYANGNFANAVPVSDSFSSTGFLTSNAALIATTNTYTTHDQEIHIDLVTDEQIMPPERRNEWQFDVNGVIHLPQDGDIVDSNGASVLRDSIFPYNDDLYVANVIDLSKDIHVLVNTTNGYQIPNGFYNGQTLKFIADSSGGVTDINAIQISGNFAVNTSNAVQTSNINWLPFANTMFNSAMWYNNAWHAVMY